MGAKGFYTDNTRLWSDDGISGAKALRQVQGCMSIDPF
jgi:hypothetical protein